MKEYLERICRENGGWLTESDVEALRLDPNHRLQSCLVRCGGCRFTAPAQDVKFLIECVEKNGDYVRDVCIPANDPIWKGVRS